MTSVPTAVDRADRAVPPEWWERAARSLNTWLVDHPRFWRTMRVAAGVSRWLTLLGVAALVVFVPHVAYAMRLPASAVAGLIVITLLARTRTLSAHAVLVLFCVALPWSVVLGLTSAGLAAVIGLSATSAGPMIALAVFVEEIGKLVPLLVLAVAAPGRVRRFSLADWYVAGWALGTGFFVVEEFGRRIGGPNIGLALDELFSDRSGTWTPWHVEVWENLDSRFAGHFVVSSLVTTAVGLGFLLARYAHRSARDGRGPSVWLRVWRVGAWAAPAVMLLWAITAHLGNNAGVQSYGGSGQTSSLAFGPGLYVFWVLTGKGAGGVTLSVLLLVAAWVVDSYRRARAGVAGQVLVGLPVPHLSAPGAWPASLRVAAGGAWAAIAYVVQDWALILAAHRRRGAEPRRHAMRRGQAARMAVRATWGAAMRATTPGAEPASRSRVRRWALIIGIAVIVIGCAWGTWRAAMIGETLIDLSAAQGYITAVLDSLARFWDRLGPVGQILVGALAIPAVMAFGASFGAAAAGVGILAWIAAHGHGLADFVRDPQTATRDYLKRAATHPGDAAMDLVDLALTFLPGAWLARVPVLRTIDELVGDLVGVVADDAARLAGRFGAPAVVRMHAADGATRALTQAATRDAENLMPVAAGARGEPQGVRPDLPAEVLAREQDKRVVRAEVAGRVAIVATQVGNQIRPSQAVPSSTRRVYPFRRSWIYVQEN